MNLKEGLAPSIQTWLKQASVETLQERYLHYAGRREIKARDAEMVATLKAAIGSELEHRGADIPEVPQTEETDGE